MDPYWALSDEADIPGRAAEHEAQEAALVSAETALRQGVPVLCQNHHLPSGVYDLLGRPGQRKFRVSPSDVVELVD